MKNLKIRLVLILSAIFCIGFLGGLGIKFLYESKSFHPYTWDGYHPIILNCYGPEFSELQMIRAIDYWAVRGHPIGFYEHNPPESVCKEGDLWGMIILRKGRLEPNTLATTKRGTTGLIIRSAEITYQSGAYNLHLINEHELGHAFGYSHVEIEGHIMHPQFHRMGEAFYIP